MTTTSNNKLNEILDNLNYSVKNRPNVKSIIKKISKSFDIDVIGLKEIKGTKQLKENIQEVFPGGKYLEAVQVIFRVAEYLKAPKDTLKKLSKLRDFFKLSRDTDYVQGREYISNDYEEFKEKLEKIADSDKTPGPQRRVALFYSQVGSIRAGELLNTKVTHKKTPPNEDYNWISLKGKKYYAYKHKNKDTDKTERVIKLSKEFVKGIPSEVSEGHYYVTDSDSKMNSPKFTRMFKKMLGITSLKLRHLQAVYASNQSGKEQKETAKTLGHSVSTMRNVYGNDMYSGEITDKMIKDAEKHLQKLMKLQTKEKNIE